jgi:dTDP-4-dehydrorhamnose 3,5-epimerase-like enzyme
VSKLFDIKTITTSGQLSIFEDFPFDIKRIFYIYNTSLGVIRGHHAHKKIRQILIAVSGKCIVSLDNLSRKEDVVLDSPSKALLLEPNDWHTMHSFTDDCVLLVLASEKYDESDYLRNYDDFKKYYGAKN